MADNAISHIAGPFAAVAYMSANRPARQVSNRSCRDDRYHHRPGVGARRDHQLHARGQPECLSRGERRKLMVHAPRGARHGFTVNQVGASYAVDLAGFGLRGTRFMQLRNKISRAFRAGLTVVESTVEEWQDAMRALDRRWLGSKGEAVPRLEFLVGQYGGAMQRHRRLFVGLIDGELVGYISYSPVYGSRPGWMHDLSRRVPDNTPGLMEAINRTAMERFQAEGVRWLHFGFTPFTSLDAGLEIAGHSPGFAMFMGLLWEHGEEVYPAKTQLAYKQKWAPEVVLPEYVACQGAAGVAALMTVVEMFGAVCHDPDDAEVTAAADASLRDLDALLAAAA